MPPSVQVVSFTTFSDNVRGFKRYCSEHNLDPKTPVAFARFWKSRDANPSLFFHLGVVVDDPTAMLCTAYGLLVTQPTQDQWFVYGSLSSWGYFFLKQPKECLTQAILPKLKGMGFYELLS